MSDKELNEDTSFKVSIKTLLGIGAGMATIISMWFILQADIQEAKELPVIELPEPEVTRMEFDMKDQLIRQTIMTTQEDVEEIQVVEFNAKWNSSKNVSWLNKLSDCSVGRLLIDENPKFQSKYKIMVVPTIIVFRDGEEMGRFQANIMMDMEVTLEEIQESIDDAHMEGF